MKHAKKRPNYAFVPVGHNVRSNAAKRQASPVHAGFTSNVSFARADSITSAPDGTLIFGVKKPGILRSLFNRFRRLASS